jgi:predicted phosphodiesterase
VLDRLAALGWPVVLGNADHFLLEIPVDTNEEPTEAQLARRGWSLAHLEERHLEQIRSFVPTHERDGLLAFHGSPRSFDDILFPETEDDSPWRVDGYALLAGGHTHVQWTKRVGDAQYVNPGSVGLAVDRFADRKQMPYAEFALVSGHSVEFRHCAY